MMSSSLRQERARWSWKVQELQRRLQSVAGDALLSAAAVELLGPLWRLKRSDESTWHEVRNIEKSSWSIGRRVN